MISGGRGFNSLPCHRNDFMKIAYFTDTYEPQVNGVVTSINLFAKELRKNGNKIYIFYPDDSKTRKGDYSCTVNYMEFRGYSGYRVALPSLSLIDEVKRIQPDVIHIHCPASLGLSGLAIAKMFRIPVVMTYHTLLSEYFRYVMGDFYDKGTIATFTKWFFGESSLVISPSSQIKNLLRRYGIDKPIEVLPTPLEFKIFRRESTKNNKNPTILHVGRICREKRIDVVIRAFKDVLKEIDAKLIITSDGPDKERMESLTNKLGLKDKVVFTGYLSRKKLKELYSKADVFVSASDTETQGIVVLEALAYGCPVIVRNALGFKDFVQNRKNGILFNTQEELSKNILLILRNKSLRKRLVEEGYKTAKRYDTKTATKELENIYEHVRKAGDASRFFWRITYAFSLILGLMLSLYIKLLKPSMNARFFGLFFGFLKLSLKFEKRFLNK